MNNLADHLRNAYPDKKQKDLIPILQDIQEQYGYISENHIQLASKILNVSESNIYDIASFYDQFKFTHKAKIEIKICTCHACHIIRSHKLMVFLKLKLNIQDKFRTICIPKTQNPTKIQLVDNLCFLGFGAFVAFFFFYFLEFTHNGLKKIVKKKGSTANFVEYFTNCISICGISNIERTLEDVIQGNNDFNVLEFSNCSMVCIGSRIQQCLTPHANEKARNLIKTIYKLDDNTNMKNPANNPFIKNFLNNNILPGMKRT